MEVNWRVGSLVGVVPIELTITRRPRINISVHFATL